MTDRHKRLGSRPGSPRKKNYQIDRKLRKSARIDGCELAISVYERISIKKKLAKRNFEICADLNEGVLKKHCFKKKILTMFSPYLSVCYPYKNTG